MYPLRVQFKLTTSDSISSIPTLLYNPTLISFSASWRGSVFVGLRLALLIRVYLYRSSFFNKEVIFVNGLKSAIEEKNLYETLKCIKDQMDALRSVRSGTDREKTENALRLLIQEIERIKNEKASWEEYMAMALLMPLGDVWNHTLSGKTVNNLCGIYQLPENIVSRRVEEVQIFK